MEFLNPLMLWGSLAVGIPIALHFWHQKKGQLLNWAATQWLTEKDLQPSRGIRLDNVLLLIIRCLLVVLLALLLAKPILHWATSTQSPQKIHLVQLNPLVVDNYKFELEEALKKGEKIYKIGAALESLNDISSLTYSGAMHPLELQTNINKANELNREVRTKQFEIYLVNSQGLSQVPNIFVPGTFTLHSVVDTLSKTPKPYLEFAGKHKLFVNQANQLTVAAVLPPNEKFESQPLPNNAVNVLVALESKAEKQAIWAALKALTEVYQIGFLIDEKLNSQKQYDWVFMDNKLPLDVKVFSSQTRFIFSEANHIPRNGEWKTAQFSGEMLTNGRLPEWLGEVLVSHFQLNPVSKTLSNQQLNALFKTLDTKNQYAVNQTKGVQFSKWIFLFFIIILGIERWLAIQKNA
ncbi:BatA domain-containing protein [Runella salmonicolor]|uniref:BatA domain-containing protein n=1 Tax=Runella salmonicolor TaxID=2950278 RepID=A0ABT1FKE6_9BACT|nr:BatA domain-containing protein [Runella salmonicolor]MCP1381995.1 BatA domain-containing protein [Runella salmonicolor]